MRRLWIITLLAIAILGGSVIAGCGDDDDDSSDDAADDGGGEFTAEQQAAIDYMNSLVALYNSDDTEAFVAEFTDNGLAEFAMDPDTPPDELREQAVEFFAGGDPAEIIEFNSVEATETDATVNLTSALGGLLRDETFVLAQESTDNFQVDGYTIAVADVPEGVTAVDVEAVEFGYRFEAPTDSNFALILHNEGEQFHEIALIKVADEAPELDQLVEIALAVEDENNLPPEFESLAAVEVAPPGEDAGVIFQNPPAPGRYAMMCFLPDETQSTETEDGPPHASLGMYAEFTTE